MERPSGASIMERLGKIIKRTPAPSVAEPEGVSDFRATQMAQQRRSALINSRSPYEKDFLHASVNLVSSRGSETGVICTGINSNKADLEQVWYFDKGSLQRVDVTRTVDKSEVESTVIKRGADKKFSITKQYKSLDGHSVQRWKKEFSRARELIK